MSKNPVGYLYTAKTYKVESPRVLMYGTACNDVFFSYAVDSLCFDKNTHTPFRQNVFPNM